MNSNELPCMHVLLTPLAGIENMSVEGVLCGKYV